MNNLLVRLLRYVFPRRYWYRNFYLRSYHWRTFRRKVLERAKYKCSHCGKEARDVHHLTYGDWRGSILFRETLKDCVAVCRECHIKIENEKRKNESR